MKLSAMLLLEGDDHAAHLPHPIVKFHFAFSLWKKAISIVYAKKTIRFRFRLFF